MRKLYEAVLRLYPAEYRVAFGSEMVQTMEQVSAHRRLTGRIAFLSFTVCELTGLAAGLVSEWIAKWSAGGGYVTPLCWPQNDSDLPIEIAEVQRRLRRALTSMEFAIAHHDFSKARFYSDEECVTRALLERLMNKYRVESPIDDRA